MSKETNVFERIVTGLLCMLLVACASHMESLPDKTAVVDEAATSIKIEGRYERLDGESVLILRDDSTYTSSDRNMWNGKFYDYPGAYEREGCSGNYKFYTADGDTCCVSIEQKGSTFVFERTKGYTLRVCEGGVYKRVE